MFGEGVAGYDKRMKILRFCGRLVAVMACLGGGGCGERGAGVPESGPARVELVPVSGERALEEVAKFVSLGPRDSGTEGAARAAEYLRTRFEELGVMAEVQAFEDDTPQGRVVFRNVIGKIPGKSGRILLLGSHYDTKSGIEGFEGANDSGSSTGLLLELGRVLAEASPMPLEIWLAHFDGEECMVEYGPRDGLHGSRYLARKLEAEGRIEDVAAMILLDMIGDRDLTVTIPRNSTPELVAMAFAAAREEGVRRHFELHDGQVLDDHVPFLERGVPAIDLIDFRFGSLPGRNDWWHTAEDSMDKLSAESLDIVGRVTARMIREIMEAESGVLSPSRPDRKD